MAQMFWSSGSRPWCELHRHCETDSAVALRQPGVARSPPEGRGVPLVLVIVVVVVVVVAVVAAAAVVVARAAREAKEQPRK